MICQVDDEQDSFIRGHFSTSMVSGFLEGKGGAEEGSERGSGRQERKKTDHDRTVFSDWDHLAYTFSEVCDG